MSGHRTTTRRSGSARLTSPSGRRLPGWGQSARVLAAALAGAAGAALAGCASPSDPPGPPVPPAVIQDPPRAHYPEGPYELRIGGTIPDLEFTGYPDPASGAPGELSRMSLSDFYNPLGHDAACRGADPDPRCLYPEDSGYPGAGGLQPTALLVNISARWCSPCNLEAATVLPARHALYAPCGGELLLDLHDGLTAGPPATAEDLTAWTTKYALDYPAVIDPANSLDPLFTEPGFPASLIIDTTTMKIVDAAVGVLEGGTCSDVYACETDADCGYCLGSGTCASGAPCETDADCSAEKCTPTPFWAEYEVLLDRDRPGCDLP